MQLGAVPGQGAINSGGDHLRALLRSGTPRSLCAPQQNTIPHALTGPHIWPRPPQYTHNCAVKPEWE